jgi:phosphoribosylaminoimidazole synthetase
LRGVRDNVRASYASSGVDISAADAAKELMRDAVRATHGPQVLAGMGAFAGVYDLSRIGSMQHPALVASTDGVGTKTLIAAQAGRFETIGSDLVNHSVNDLLTQGATPLFFMDYLAMGKLDPMHAATIVKSVATACQEVGCALLGGETAEMPDVYLPGAFDLAGTIVGIVEQGAVISSQHNISVGDILLGLPSTGLHTNGYSLARRVFAPFALDTIFPELEEPLVDVLLRPHRCYLREIQTLCQYPGISIKGIAHITGGGFEGNIARILPPGIQAVVESGSWKVPPIFAVLGRLGQVTLKEMYRTFNMGVGMVCIVSPEVAKQAQHLLPELLTVGYITEGEGVILQ